MILVKSLLLEDLIDRSVEVIEHNFSVSEEAGYWEVGQIIVFFLKDFFHVQGESGETTPPPPSPALGWSFYNWAL